MKRFVVPLGLLLLSACASSGPRPESTPTAPDDPFSIVLFIGDGTGVAYWSAARLAVSHLAIEQFPTIGLMATRSVDNRITDSAAGGTAISTGVRTFNGFVAVAPDSSRLPTVLERAAKKGMGTGVVVTSAVTHATPATFIAHVPNRNRNWDIAAQIADEKLNVLLGGGRQYFDPTRRADHRDLLALLRRRGTYVDSPGAFAALDPDTIRTLIGLFAENHPGSATERRPSLPDLTEAALRVLAHQRKGFFLMVEGSQIDWRGHENAPLGKVLPEVLDLDLAIRRALAYQETHPHTLIVVLADHNTGGLALHEDETGTFGAHYTTIGHTAAMVPIFARGPGASALGAVLDNSRVGRILLDLVARGGAGMVALRPDTSASAVWTPSSH